MTVTRLEMEFKKINMIFNIEVDFKFLKQQVDIVQNLYSKTTIDIDGHKIQTTAGVRQGGPESPLLFNLYIDFVMRIFMTHAADQGWDFFKFKYRIPTTREERSTKRDPTTGTAQLDWSGYADDIVLYLLSLASLQTSLPLIDSVFKRFKLQSSQLEEN